MAIANGLSDIVTERYDEGVRLGEIVAQDMIAVPIGPDTQMVVAATPDHLASHRGRRRRRI